MKTGIAAALVAAMDLLYPSTTLAQEASSRVTQSGAADIAKALGDTPTAPTEPWQPFRSTGIALTLTYTGEAAANPIGGLRQSAAYAGQVFAGVDADMFHIAGIRGATIHVAVTNRHGESLSAIAIGNNTSVQEIYGTQNTHLALLTWQQKLFGDRFEFEVGRSVSNVAFIASPLYCSFQSNAVCGNPVMVYFASNFSGFPASRWAAHATIKPFGKFRFHAGAYEVNPDRGAPGDHGLDFGIRNATGVLIPWEIGYDPTIRRLPGHYEIGGWFDRSRYDDPLRDETGGIALETGSKPAKRFNRTGLYARFDQRLTHSGLRSARGLTIFGVAMTSIAGRVSSNRFLELGLVQTGTLLSRDQDTIGLAITDLRFSDIALMRLAAGRRLAERSDLGIDRHQTMAEINYGIQVNKSMRIMPNLQYIISPDQYNVPIQRRKTQNVLVFGVRITLDGLNLMRSFSHSGI